MSGYASCSILNIRFLIGSDGQTSEGKRPRDEGERNSSPERHPVLVLPLGQRGLAYAVVGREGDRCSDKVRRRNRRSIGGCGLGAVAARRRGCRSPDSADFPHALRSRDRPKVATCGRATRNLRLNFNQGAEEVVGPLLDPRSNKASIKSTSARPIEDEDSPLVGSNNQEHPIQVLSSRRHTPRRTRRRPWLDARDGANRQTARERHPSPEERGVSLEIAAPN